MDILVCFYRKLHNNLLNGNIIFICIKFLQIMYSFDCLVELDPNFSRLPVEILRMIEPYYTKSLIKRKEEIIQRRQTYNYKLKSEIIEYGRNHSNLCERIHSGLFSIPESFSFVKYVAEHKWNDYDFPRISIECPAIPEWRKWRIQLKAKLHLKYKTDFVHCLTQMKLFAGYFKQGNTDLTITFQFGNNLGRLREIINKPEFTIFCKEEVERLFLAQDWIGLDESIDTIQKRFQIGYDRSILEMVN